MHLNRQHPDPRPGMTLVMTSQNDVSAITICLALALLYKNNEGVETPCRTTSVCIGIQMPAPSLIRKTGVASERWRR